jgi:hypothetical protein
VNIEKVHAGASLGSKTELFCSVQHHISDQDFRVFRAFAALHG